MIKRQKFAFIYLVTCLIEFRSACFRYRIRIYQNAKDCITSNGQERHLDEVNTATFVQVVTHTCESVLRAIHILWKTFFMRSF